MDPIVLDNEGSPSTEEVSNHAPSWNTKKKFLEDDEIVPEEGYRYSHKVRPERSDEEVDYFASKIAHDTNKRSIPDMSRINDNAEDSTILDDIERNPKPGGLGSEGGGLVNYLVGLAKAASTGNATYGEATAADGPVDRRRSASLLIATKGLFDRSRHRKGSQASVESVDFLKGEKARFTGLKYCIYQCRRVIAYLTPDLAFRGNVYLAFLFLLTIAFVARDFNAPGPVFKLFIYTILLEFGCSMVDRVVYKIIDVVFASRFDIAYQLHSLNGPLGLILTVLIVRHYWYLLDAVELVKGWRSYVTAAAVFIICLCAKNWIGRRQYVYLLERRFTDKMESLNTMIIILSELGSTRPPKSAQLQRASTKTGEGEGDSAHSTATLSTHRSATKLSSKVTHRPGTPGLYTRGCRSCCYFRCASFEYLIDATTCGSASLHLSLALR
jgi:hypothetical protein